MTINELLNKFPYPTSVSNPKDLLREASYMMYEFEEKTVPSSKPGVQSKTMSPLMDQRVINSESNQQILDIITEGLPFYYIENTLPRSAEDEEILSITRDPGLNDVPAPMQTSFWSVWFRESQAEIQNKILLDVFNKLRYPFINENQYLNATLFPELAAKTFGENADDDDVIIEFRNSEEENIQDRKDQYSIGCIDYIEGIISSKLQSVYNILDYNPDMSSFLSSWGESYFKSGRLDYYQTETEKSVFKLQDLDYELLRRKFAGSSTLYKLSLSSIDRQGSFVGIIPVGKLKSNFEVFKDPRTLRIVSIPGILSQPADMTAMRPLDVYYNVPLSEGENVIELGTLSPLFYTSNFQTVAVGSNSLGTIYSNIYYDAEDFYITGTGNLDRETYMSKFLRDNTSTVNWEELEGILSAASVNTFYPKLDEKPRGEYRTLDGDYVDSEGNSSTMKLDITTPFFSMAAIVGNSLDINANHLLFHENILQKNLEDLYPFLTYRIAEGNSVSLMDSAWISYLKSSTERKSRVQDNIQFGTQISKYYFTATPLQADYPFIGISYLVDDNLDDAFTKIYSYDECIKEFGAKPKYAYLWYLTFSYDINANVLVSVQKSLITKIALKVGEVDNKFNEIDEYVKLKTNNRGLLPFTYQGIKDEKVAGMKIGLYEDPEGNLNFYDDLEDLGYTKAYFYFADADNINVDRLSDINYLLNTDVSSNTRSFIYQIDRTEVPKSNSDLPSIKKVYSESVKVYPLFNKWFTNTASENSILLSIFKPEWDGLLYHLNPYFNFNKESASPLRNKPLNIFSESFDSLSSELKADMENNPSEYAGLCSVNRTRNMGYLCNDLGSLDKKSAFYLERIKPLNKGSIYSTLSREKTIILGDNRSTDIFANRNDIVTSEENINCISFRKGTSDEIAAGGYLIFAPNQFKLQPIRSSLIYGIGEDADVWGSTEGIPNQMPDSELKDIKMNWVWNKPATGLSLIFNLKFDSVCLDDKIEKYTDENNISMARYYPADYVTIAARDSLTITEDIDSEFGLYVETLPNSEDGTSIFDEEGNVDIDKLPTSIISGWVNGEYISKPLNPNNFLKKKIHFRYYFAGNRKYYFEVSSNVLTKEYLISTNAHIGASASVSEDTEFIYVNLNLVINNKLYAKNFRTNKVDNQYTFESLKLKKDSLTADFEDPLNNDNWEVIFEDKKEEITSFIESHKEELYREDSPWAHTGKNFLPGYPIKYNGKNKLEFINLFSSYGDETLISQAAEREIGATQEHMFFGDVFDFKLYNEGFSKYNLYIIANGSVREHYSMSPAAYKLGYSIYKDLGIARPIKGIPVPAGNLPKIGSIRIFTRGVWDSIITDLFPTSEAEMSLSSPQYYESYRDPLNDTDVYTKVDEGEYDLKAIEQTLVSNTEVSNNIRPQEDDKFKTRILYNSQVIDLHSLDWVNVINTMIYPVYYKNELFESKATLSVDFPEDVNSPATIYTLPTTQDGSISGLQIPARPVGNTLKYSGDLSLNFIIEDKSDLSVFYSRGSNIELAYNDALGKSVIKLKDDSIKSSTQNFVLIPFTIAERTKAATSIFLTSLQLQGVQFNKGIATFLKATSYYNEMRLPVAYQSSLSEPVEWISRWDAIRTLREGTYYFTCKYPIQIQHFTDELHNLTAEASYATLYAAARFKIVVKGTPKSYDLTEPGIKIEGYPSKYLKTSISSTLNNGQTLWSPSDNRNFPHRIVDIDMYSMEYAGEDQYDWKLIASNHNSDVKSLNNLQDSFVIEDPITLFLCKNYTSPFFIAGTPGEEVGEDSTFAVDDVIKRIDIRGVDTKEDNITVNSESDLDGLTLVSGRSYKLLFDYNGRLSEFSFTDKYFNERELLEERQNYARLTSLLDETLPSDYLYNGACAWYSNASYIVNGLTSGYAIEKDSEGKDNFTEKLIGMYEKDENGNSDSSKPITINKFGNPYSRAASKNYLLEANKQFRNEIDNLAYFPYLCEEVPEKTYFPAAYKSSLDVVEARTSAVYNLNTIAIDENAILAKLWQSIRSRSTAAISALKNSASGIFNSLSNIYPVKAGEDDVTTETKILSKNFDLYAYTASDRSTPSRNDNIVITRRGIYSNNIIKSQNYDDRSFWVVTPPKSSAPNNLTFKSGYYVSDDSWDKSNGKDVYKFEDWKPLDSNEKFSLTYITQSKSITAKFETAVNIKVVTKDINNNALDELEGIRIVAVYLKDSKEVASIELVNKQESQLFSEMSLAESIPMENNIWYVFSNELKEAITADTIRFDFYANLGKANSLDLYLTKVVVRRSSILSHKLGLADALYNVSTSGPESKINMTSHNIICFKNKKSGEFLPIQFFNKIKSYAGSNTNDATAKYAESGLTRIKDFIREYGLGKFSNNKLELLIKPWVRRLRYVQLDKQTESENMYFTSYRVSLDGLGKKIRQEVKSPVTDIFFGGKFIWDDITQIATLSDVRLVRSGNYLKEYNTNLKLYAENIITLEEERFTGLINCFNPERYLKGLSTPVAVTNIQLLTDGVDAPKEIVYEFEYLPIIYDELDQHISMNFLIHKAYS